MQFEQEIKQALRNAGLDENLSTKINVSTVDEIAGAVKQLKADTTRTKSLTTEEFLNALKEAGLDDAYKRALQSETDRRVTDAIKTHEEKLKQAAGEKPAAKQKEPETMTAEEKRIQALEESNKALMDKLEGVVKRLETGDMDSRIQAELKNAGLADEFAPYIRVDDPEKIADAVTGFKVKLDAHNQAAIDKKVEAGDLSPVKKGSAGTTLAETNITEYAKGLTAGGAPKDAPFQGKIAAEKAAIVAAGT